MIRAKPTLNPAKKNAMQSLDLLKELEVISVQAGKKILTVYAREEPVDVAYKDDASPLTEADRRAHEHIVAALRELPGGFPVLSEESAIPPFPERAAWDSYWLVDPLDGTKEFIKRNGEFTVNIALIEAGLPTLGVVHVPVSGESYLGAVGVGAWKIDRHGARAAIECSALDAKRRVRVMASRSHSDPNLAAILARIEDGLAATDLVSMGSSLKLCLLAEGRADIYPRLAPTSEWDTAAAHAVLAAAGGIVVDTRFQALAYNQKESLLNPHFLAFADSNFDWQALLAPALFQDN